MKERKKVKNNKDRKDKHSRRMTIGFSPRIFRSQLQPNLEQPCRQDLQVSTVTTFPALIVTKCCRHISLETGVLGNICQVSLVASRYMIISKGFRALAASIGDN